MTQLPPLTEVIRGRSGKAETEFKNLMEILLIRHGRMHDFQFVQDKSHKYLGIDGIVEDNYFEQIQCPVIFYFKWLTDHVDRGLTAENLTEVFSRVLTSKVATSSIIIATPVDISPAEKVSLADAGKNYGIEVYHYGPTIIYDLMEDHPPLKKFYLGRYMGRDSLSFEEIGDDYRGAAAEQAKHLEFVGLPTGQYQQQQLLKKTELRKVYIPLEFGVERTSIDRSSLEKIVRSTNRFVILGDPGTGKSTLTKYLTLIASKYPKKSGATSVMTPFIIQIRDYFRVWQSKSGLLSIFEYLRLIAESNYGIKDIDEDFFKALLDLGRAIVVFDGLDEISSESGRIRMARTIKQFCRQYPDSPVWITSRIIGYSEKLGFEDGTFFTFYIRPVTPEQVKKFIERWYEIQIPNHNTYREERIESLKAAVNENPGVKRLKTNPLLLTMMTLVHQYEGTLPDDRARLYEKCVELLLRTWQDQKYAMMGEENPLDERGLNYNEQMRLLAATALYIQVRNQDEEEEESRGLIEENELADVLFQARYDRKRMSAGGAREDVRVFLDYIRGRSGLLVERGKSQKGENLFSFVHLSFLDYLCAYQIAEDRSKPKWQHVQQLVFYLGKTAWDEIILLALYFYSRSSGRAGDFVDEFAKWAFEKITKDKLFMGWFLLGNAVRDNIDFASEDTKRIIQQILHVWFKRRGVRSNAFSILCDIAEFSRNGGKMLKAFAKGVVGSRPPDVAFDFLNLYERSFGIDADIISAIEKNKERTNLHPYIPVFRSNEGLDKYLDITLSVKEWFIYFNSTKNRSAEHLTRLIAGNNNNYELTGLVLSTWSRLLMAFEEREAFFELNSKGHDMDVEYVEISYGQSHVRFPLTLFKSYKSPVANVGQPLKINDSTFVMLDKVSHLRTKEEFFKQWLDDYIKEALLETPEAKRMGTVNPVLGDTDFLVKLSAIDTEFVSSLIREINEAFGHYLTNDFCEDFSKYLEFELQPDFWGNFGKVLKDEYGRFFALRVVKPLVVNLTTRLAYIFARRFASQMNKEFSTAIILTMAQVHGKDSPFEFDHRFDWDDNLDFNQLISAMYLQEYGENLHWETLTSEEFDNIHRLFVQEFERENKLLISQFYYFLYNYLFRIERKIEFLSFSAANEVKTGVSKTIGKAISSSIENVFFVPFSVDFILNGAVNHYVINLLAALSSNFYEKKEIDKDIAKEVIESYLIDHPFDSYLVNFSWEYYANAFYETFRQNPDFRNLGAAAFIANAAGLTQITGVPCEGVTWEKILEVAENMDDIFVQISVALYKITTFEETDKYTKWLKELLNKFKNQQPNYYELIGLKDKEVPFDGKNKHPGS